MAGEGGFNVEQLLTLEIFNTPKDVLPSSMLVYHIRELPERHGNGEFTSIYNFFFIYKKTQIDDDFEFVASVKLFVELSSILRVPASRYLITFPKAGFNLNFPELNWDDRD